MEYLSRLAPDPPPSHSSEAARRLRQIWAAQRTLGGRGRAAAGCPMTNGDEGLVTNLPLAGRKAPVATEWLSNEYKTALRGLPAAGYNIRTACEGSAGHRCRSLCCLSGSFYEFYPAARWVLQTGGMWKTTKMTH